MAGRGKIADILIKAGVIDELQLRSALHHMDQWGGRVTRAVVELGLADEEKVVQALSQGTGVPVVHLGHLSKDPAVLAKLDERFCEQRAVFPVALKDGGKTLVVAMADPTDLAVVDEISAKSRCRVSLSLTSDHEIERAIRVYYKGIEEPITANRARAAVLRAVVKPSGGDEDFQITDMSGKTLFKTKAELANDAAEEEKKSSPGAMLDEILGASVTQGGLTAEELQRLEAVRLNQEKSGKILRAILELLLEKRLTTKEQLQGKIRL